MVLLLLAPISLFCNDNNTFSLSFTAGVNGGSIAPVDVDVVSSATIPGGHASAQLEMDINDYFGLETGLIYTLNFEELIYKDTTRGIDGDRTFWMHNLTLPILFNVHLFNRKDGSPFWIIGLGIFGSFFPYQGITDSGTLPSYNIKNVAAGPFLQVNCYPLEIYDKYQLGLSIRLFRTISLFYEDEYYSKTYFKAGDWANLLFGVTMRYKL